MSRGEISLTREVTYEDAMQIADWLDDKEVARYLNEGDYVGDSIRSKIQSLNLPVYNSLFNNKGSFHLIQLKDEPIGYANLIPNGRSHEIVIVVGKKELWGHGFGNTALRKLLDHAFFEMRTQTVTAKITHLNHRSIRLFKHLGFDEKCTYEKNILLSLDFSTYLKMAA